MKDLIKKMPRSVLYVALGLEILLLVIMALWVFFGH